MTLGPWAILVQICSIHAVTETLIFSLILRSNSCILFSTISGSFQACRTTEGRCNSAEEIWLRRSKHPWLAGVRMTISLAKPWTLMTTPDLDLLKIFAGTLTVYSAMVFTPDIGPFLNVCELMKCFFGDFLQTLCSFKGSYSRHCCRKAGLACKTILKKALNVLTQKNRNRKKNGFCLVLTGVSAQFFYMHWVVTGNWER